MSYSNRVYLHSYTHFYTILETLMWSIFEAKCVKVVFYMILHPLMWMLLVFSRAQAQTLFLGLSQAQTKFKLDTQQFKHKLVYKFIYIS